MMREYLEKFFQSFAYDEADAAYLLQAYDRIVENPEAGAQWNRVLAMYETDMNCDFDKLLEESNVAADFVQLHHYTTQLLICICMSRSLRKAYAKRGIREEIFHNSMLDLKYKLEECKLVKGIIGSFVAGWFIGFFQMTRFGLGRLQFELIDFGHQFEKDGLVLTPQTKVINMHIPRTGTPLDPVACDEAFALASAFFRPQIGDVCVFVCHSWLLYPEHEKILSPNSNVYKFMKRFMIAGHGVRMDMGELWRLFDTDEKNVQRLPADSSMRRAYIEHLRNGGFMGWGQGMFIYNGK